jgi:hypothetical protein
MILRNSGSLEVGRKMSHPCTRCGNTGKPRQLNELLRFDRNEPVIALCNECLHLLKYADAATWKWFRNRLREARQ